MKYILVALFSIALMPSSWANWSKDGKRVESAVISFDKGVSQLSADQKKQISELIGKAPKKGDDFDMGIAAWADQPFPAGNKSLSADQRDLAQKRINAIEDYVSEVSYAGDVDTFNMARRSNWLARLFNTETAELKSMFSKRDDSTSLLKDKYQAFKDKGDSQKAVLVLSKD